MKKDLLIEKKWMQLLKATTVMKIKTSLNLSDKEKEQAVCRPSWSSDYQKEKKKKRKGKERKGKRQIIKWDTEDEKLGRKGEKSITNVNGETSDM